MGDSVAQVHQGGQQPVDEHQPVPGASSDRQLPRPLGQSSEGKPGTRKGRFGKQSRTRFGGRR